MNAPAKTPTRSRKRRLRRTAVVFTIGTVALIAAAPTIISKTGLRDVLLNRALDDPHLTASVSDASFGWFTAGRLSTLQVARDDRSFRLDIDRVGVKKSLWDLLTTIPAVGTVEIERPRLSLVIGPEVQLDEQRSSNAGTGVTLTADVRHADFRVVVADDPEPIVDMQDVTVYADIRRTQTGRALIVAPVVLFDHKRLSEEFCDRGLQLVAPVLANAASVTGELTLELTKCRVPLDDSPDSPSLEGNVQLHAVQATLKNPLLQQLVAVLSQYVGRELPQSVRVLEESRIDFRVEKRGVHHQGLAFVLPEVSQELVIRSSGYVGFDESLDLTIEVALPRGMTSDIPVLNRLTAQPLAIHVGGTTKEPKLGFPQGRDLLDELAQRLNRPEDGAPPQSVEGAVLDLVGGLVQPKEKGKVDPETTTRDIVNLIRAARDRKREKAKEESKNKQ